MRGILLLALVLVVAGVAAPAAAAQETPTDDAENETAAPPDGERIDGSTELIDAEHLESTGQAKVTLRSESLQRITLTDAGGVLDGGEVDRRTVTIGAGETATYRVPATEVRGEAAVTIDTGEVLYAVPLKVSTPWFQGDPTWTTTRIVGAGAIVGVLFVSGWLARKRLLGGEGEVKQLA